ncbi:hypothetical protein [uncultured Gimesia sp.]|uniref:hypothetical protein n=1 Tax=uncultured Gimesia sp. TaxID=1678688 RepID=UPI00260DBB67|nr:hypothetical protein [uncultured Gimesia sp.]
MSFSFFITTKITKGTKSSVDVMFVFISLWNFHYYLMDFSISFLLDALGLNFIRAYPLLSNAG